MKYMRSCKQNQWETVGDVWRYAERTLSHLQQRNQNDATARVGRAMLGEQLAILDVLLGKPWDEIREI